MVESLLAFFYVLGCETTGVSSNFGVLNGTIHVSLNFSEFLGFNNKLGVMCDTTTSRAMVFVNWDFRAKWVLAFSTFIKGMDSVILKLKW